MNPALSGPIFQESYIASLMAQSAARRRPRSFRTSTRNPGRTANASTLRSTLLRGERITARDGFP
jgi:hypothetical protein